MLGAQGHTVGSDMEDQEAATYKALIAKLRPFADKFSEGRMHGEKMKLFSLCLRASFAKCYEFCSFAHEEHESRAFFLAPT